jgi:carbamate kinase
MGYILARALRDEIRSRKIDLPVACLVTSVIVEELNASRKPIGPLLRADEARRLEKERGWRVVREERGLRRVVPSPTPTSVLEIDATRSLLSTGYLVIAGGGGGIALARDSEGMLRGVDAVVDKDRTATLLAIELGRKRIVHLTSVDAIYRDHGTPAETPITRMRVDEARRLLDQGQFPEGSMGPKIEASIQFLQAGGESVLVTAADRLPDALAERAGTWILP